MRKHSPTFLMSLLFIALITSAPATAAQTSLKVCGNPATPCKSRHKEFVPYELPMTLPARVKPNTSYKSEAFFAVVLKDKIAVTADEECDGGEFTTKVENERQKVQTLFPNNKAFAGHQCPDMGALGYLVNGEPYNEVFIAVYGGATMDEANTVLQAARIRYPKATIKKMQTVFEHIVQ